MIKVQSTKLGEDYIFKISTNNSYKPKERISKEIKSRFSGVAYKELSNRHGDNLREVYIVVNALEWDRNTLQRKPLTPKGCKPPRYIKLEGTAMRLRGDYYYRDNGAWYSRFYKKDGFWYSWKPDMPWLHNKKLVEITEKEYNLDNNLK